MRSIRCEAGRRRHTNQYRLARALGVHNPFSQLIMKNPTDDPYLTFDHDRIHARVKHNARLGWCLMRHADIVRALHDWRTFSSRVSKRVSVPNGMDPPEHAPYRRIVESYFSTSHVAGFEEECRAIARALIGQLGRQGPRAEIMSELGQPFAARVQCGFLGWPEKMAVALGVWLTSNMQAIRDHDRTALAQCAHHFESLIAQLMRERHAIGATSDHDLTASLMHEQIGDRVLNDKEIASILRNWTAGEVGTIAASVGIIAQFLALNPDIQQQLRDDVSNVPYAIDEMLRIRGPLLTNRRVATTDVEIGGHVIPAGERVTIHWAAANRDGEVFEDPLAFRWDRDPTKNLLYGAGVHVCPGAPLARMELRVITEEILTQTRSLALDPERSATFAEFPAGGFASVPLLVQRAS